VTTNRSQESIAEIAHPIHTRCMLCGQSNPSGFNLVFRKCDDGSVEAFFQCNGCCEGYPDLMHGGFIALLLDGAMTNCLFAHGCTGVTARMELAFRHPVRANSTVTVQAWIESTNHPVYQLKAHLLQNGQVKAIGTGVFMDRRDLCSKESP